MYKLSDIVERKFVDSVDVSEWEIESENGWVDVQKINKTIEYEVYQLTTTNCFIECADNHIVFRNSGEEVFVKDLKPRDSIVGQNGIEYVISVIKTNKKENMYDLSVSGNHTYYAEGILHHNTTCVAAYLCWYLVFNDAKNVAILANKLASAQEVMDRLQEMYMGLPMFLQSGVVDWNKRSFKLANKSKAFIAATTASGIRGKSVNLLYIDEASAIPNTVADKFFASTYPTISSGDTTKIIMTSTPLGLNHFWKFWSEAEQGINGFVPVRVDYWEHPKHDKKWADDQKRLLGDLKFNQEILMDFVGSGATLIDGTKVSQLPIKRGEEIFPNYIEYESPKKDKNNKPTGNYVITVDTSRGSDLDYSAFLVIDINQMPYKVVAKYANNSISPLMYPEIIFKVGTRYNNAFILIETNDLGQQVADILFYDLEYENVYMSHKEKIKEGGGDKKTPGIRTTKRTKAIGCSQLKTLIESDHLEVNDIDTISELSTFIRKGTSYAADDGKHDDLTMCLVLFAFLTQEAVFKELFDFSLRQEFVKKQIQEFDDYITPIGFVDRGDDIVVESSFNYPTYGGWIENKTDEFVW